VRNDDIAPKNGLIAKAVFGVDRRFVPSILGRQRRSASAAEGDEAESEEGETVEFHSRIARSG
jgi:hypothetical protein